jgi:hypothetical protein
VVLSTKLYPTFFCSPLHLDATKGLQKRVRTRISGGRFVQREATMSEDQTSQFAGSSPAMRTILIFPAG